MHPYLLTAAARKDMLAIGRFTQERWGIAQRNLYLTQLDDTFKLLAQRLEVGRDAGDIKPNYRKFSQGSHTIYYRAGNESCIVIIRILHNSMDTDLHL